MIVLMSLLGGSEGSATKSEFRRCGLTVVAQSMTNKTRQGCATRLWNPQKHLVQIDPFTMDPSFPLGLSGTEKAPVNPQTDAYCVYFLFIDCVTKVRPTCMLRCVPNLLRPARYAAVWCCRRESKPITVQVCWLSRIILV